MVIAVKYLWLWTCLPKHLNVGKTVGRQYLDHNRYLTDVCKMKYESLEQYDFIQASNFKCYSYILNVVFDH